MFSKTVSLIRRKPFAAISILVSILSIFPIYISLFEVKINGSLNCFAYPVSNSQTTFENDGEYIFYDDSFRGINPVKYPGFITYEKISSVDVYKLDPLKKLTQLTVSQDIRCSYKNTGRIKHGIEKIIVSIKRHQDKVVYEKDYSVYVNGANYGSLFIEKDADISNVDSGETVVFIFRAPIMAFIFDPEENNAECANESGFTTPIKFYNCFENKRIDGFVSGKSIHYKEFIKNYDIKFEDIFISRIMVYPHSGNLVTDEHQSTFITGNFH